MDDSRPLPTFEKAGRFAEFLGITSPEGWARYCAGTTRQEMFEAVLSVANKKIILATLEE